MFFPDFSEAIVATVKSRQAHRTPSLTLVAASTLATALEMQLGNLPDEPVPPWRIGPFAL
jgi:hypothetical protein